MSYIIVTDFCHEENFTYKRMVYGVIPADATLSRILQPKIWMSMTGKCAFIAETTTCWPCKSSLSGRSVLSAIEHKWTNACCIDDALDHCSTMYAVIACMLSPSGTAPAAIIIIIIIIIIIMVTMAVFYVAGYLIEGSRRWPVIYCFSTTSIFE